LVYRLEYRDNHFTDVAPAAFATEIGAASLTTGFAYADDFGPMFTELYWKQLYNDKRIGFVIGILDFGPYFDYYPYTTLGKGFLTREFLLNPTLAITGVGHLGAAAKGFIGDHIWVGGAFYDANAVNGDLNLDTWNSDELLKHVEIGWTPDRERNRTDRVQLTYWEVDERREAGVPAGSGWALSISGEFGDRLLPFFRVGDSDGGGGAKAESHVGIGFGLTLRSDDLFSLGLARNKPSRKTFGADLNEESVLEVSYQLQISQNVSLLPDVQLIVNPANNPNKDRIWVFSLRVRLTL
jgi:porin